MIRRGIGVQSFVSAGVSNDADAQAFIDAAGITDATQQSAINTLVTDLKGYGIWTKMKAIYPFVGGTSSTHKWNLKDPRDLDAAFRLVFSGGWTHSSTGAKPNGTNGYANTYLDLLNNLTQTNTAITYYSRTTNDTGLYPTVLGGYFNFDYTKAIDLYIKRPTPGNKGGGQIGSFSTSVINYTETDAKKFAILSRTNATTLKYYTNGVLRDTNNVSDTTGFGNVTAYIGAGNYQNNIAQNYSSLECAFASIGDGLTDTEAANLYTAVQAYQTTLSRNV